MQFIDDNVVPYINDKSTAGQDLLNLFFTTFNKYVGKSDKNQAFTPDHICDFMSKAVGVNKNSRVLDPCCGSGAFLVRAMTDAMDDCDMDQLVQSIKERGIITPVTLRPKEDGRYEIVSGHRRKKACELAGLNTVKAEVREMSRDEAIILMVESNLQRSTILPSEKAFSYKMRLEAMNRQGQRTDLTSVPVAQKSTSREQLGKEVGESQDQVRRYKCLSI